mmetsp:Transcript_17280/g.40929  ORF Transcript_17280/g.40929 Transcript_17280/m.40929 type:complete len:100 (-) Transcript_17280:112-411(-)
MRHGMADRVARSGGPTVVRETGSTLTGALCVDLLRLGVGMAFNSGRSNSTLAFTMGPLSAFTEEADVDDGVAGGCSHAQEGTTTPGGVKERQPDTECGR